MKDRQGSTPESDIASRLATALTARIGSTRFQLWFEPHTVFVPTGRELILVVRNEYLQGWLEQAFGAEVRAAAAEVLGGKPTVQFVVDERHFSEEREAGNQKPAAEPTPTTKPVPGKVQTRKTLFDEEIVPPGPSKPRKGKPTEAARPTAPPTPTATTSKTRKWKTLADFVVGSTNRYAHTAALAAVEEPDEFANPLVIHGPVGTGKTHLLEGVYVGLKRRNDGQPSYITAEEFTTRFVQACHRDKQSQFRRQFRECAALILDDLHFFATKPGTQKEFIHTMDVLMGEGRPVIVTMDCHPRLADELMPELVDRLLGGAVWSLQPPDESTRLDILRKKASLAQPMIPEAMLKLLAKSLKGNVRELEGAVNTVRHVAKVTGKAVDAALVKDALGDLLRHSVRATTVADVDSAVCGALRLAAGTLQSKARSWAVSHPRMIAIYLCRKHTAATYSEIAKHFGAKTHSTAVAAEKKVRGWIQKQEAIVIGDREWSISELIERFERELQK